MVFWRRGEPRNLVGLLVISSYALLTFLFWGVYVADRGLPGETGLIELSQIRPGLQGFVYPYDGPRRFMSLSFHAAYLLSNGSYLSLHLLFGAWILLTGLLTYLILRRLTPQSALLAYLAGAVSMTFAADQGVNWAGYIVQRQTIVLSLLAIWLLLRGWESRKPWLLLLAAISQYFALWTYEACLPVLLVTPLLLFRPSGDRRRLILYGAAWSAVPIAKLTILIYSNLVLREVSYESNVLAKSVTIPALAENLISLVMRGLAFWNWPGYAYAAAVGCEQATIRQLALPVLAGAVICLLSSLLMRRLDGTGPASAGVRFGRLISLGLLFLVLAYIPFTLLQTASFLRTELVCAVPAAIVLVALSGWLDSLVRARGALLVSLTALVVACGLATGLLQQLGLQHDWTGYRKVMEGIVNALPCMKDDTMVVLVQLPRRISYSICSNDAPFDPFRDVMWFNSGLQVIYPDTRLVGIYYREDGSGSDSIRFRFASDGAQLEQSGLGLEGTHFAYEKIVAFRYDKDRGAVLLDTFPSDSVPGSSAAADYNPRSRIACTAPPAVVRHRLNLSQSPR